MTTLGPTHFEQASALLDRLYETVRTINDERITLLTDASAEAVATAALAHGVMALVEEVRATAVALEYRWGER